MSRHSNRGTIFLTEGSRYDSLRCKGTVKADGNISAESVNIKGKLTTSYDITADTEFDLKGKISAGNITAPRVKIFTGSDGTARRITGTSINIQCGLDPSTTAELMDIAGKILRLFRIDDKDIRDVAERADSQKDDPVFTCDEISGDEVELFGVTCRSVSGRNITLKEKCRVDRVTYSGNLEADDSCIIGEVVRT